VVFEGGKRHWRIACDFFGLCFSVLLGLIPSVFLIFGAIAVFWADDLSFVSKVPMSLSLLFLGAAFSFITGYMILATFSAEKAKAYAKGAGIKAGWAIGLLPKPITDTARQLVGGAKGAFRPCTHKRDSQGGEVVIQGFRKGAFGEPLRSDRV
jgi:hypothetical protein